MRSGAEHQIAQTNATIALACLFLNGFSDKKNWQPADFLPKRETEQERSEISWQQQKEMMMMAFPPPPDYPKRYTHLEPAP